MAALIGARWYAVEAPAKAAFPFVVATRTAGPRERTIGGPTGMARCRLELECDAKTYRQAKAVKEALRFHFDGYNLERGPMGAGALAAVVYSVEMEDEEDDYNYARRAKIVRAPILVWYTEETGP